MKLNEMIEVMQHFENGGEVIYRVKNVKYDLWSTCVNPLWDWYEFEYKIKREKVIIEKWLCRDEDGDYAIFEVSNIDKYEQYEKIKLIETYEIEL